MPAQNAGKPDRWTVVQKWRQADFPGPKATEGYVGFALGWCIQRRRNETG
jgi:hypothetical protein